MYIFSFKEGSLHLEIMLFENISKFAKVIMNGRENNNLNQALHLLSIFLVIRIVLFN